MSSTIEKEIDPSVPPAQDAQDAVPSKDVSLEDQTLIVLARLMEDGQEDEDTCKDLNALTRLLGEDPAVNPRFKEPHTPLFELLDLDSVETILSYLDMRQSPTVRGFATLTTSEYLRVSGQKGVGYLSDFFHTKVGKGTYDDFLVTFSVAAAIFPVVPDIISTLFLSEGFVISLGPLMRRKWKSRKVEQAALEMLNAACMNTPCREAIKKYCTEWLEEIVSTAATDTQNLATAEDGSISQRIHSEQVRNLAAVVLAKIQVGDTYSFTFDVVQYHAACSRNLTDVRIEGCSFCYNH